MKEIEISEKFVELVKIYIIEEYVIEYDRFTSKYVVFDVCTAKRYCNGVNKNYEHKYARYREIPLMTFDYNISFERPIFQCPNCMKFYNPKFNTYDEAFKTDDNEAREQWITFLCSTECWKEYLNPKKAKNAGEEL